VLSVLNLRHQARAVEAEREWVVDNLGIDDPEEALAYERVSTGVSQLRSWLTLLALLFVLFLGVFADVTAAIGGFGGVLTETTVFFGGLLVGVRLFGVPFDLVGTFVVEEVYGFNEQTLTLWVRDWIVQTAVSLALFVPLGVAVVWFVTSVPFWPAAAWGLSVGAIVAFMILKPRLIDPLFYEFEPLAESELREAVEEVFEAAGYRTDQVYEMNASTRSGHSNAYFVGFGPPKRVVLYDTLIEGMEADAVQGVLAHELAHWREGHVWKFVGLAALRLAVLFAVLGLLLDSGVIYLPVAAPDIPYVGLFVGALVLAPLNRLTSPLENYVSLGYERDADAYAVELVGGEPMARALATLAADNLAVPFPHVVRDVPLRPPADSGADASGARTQGPGPLERCRHLG